LHQQQLTTHYKFSQGMNLKNLDQAIISIAEKKKQLSANNLSSLQRAVLEDELETMELDFQANYGSIIEEALFNFHDEFCPDNDILKPSEYLALHYIPSNGGTLDVEPNEGIPVEVEDFPGTKARLVLVPSPTRLVLQGQDVDFKEVVWKAI